MDRGYALVDGILKKTNHSCIPDAAAAVHMVLFTEHVKS